MPNALPPQMLTTSVRTDGQIHSPPLCVSIPYAHYRGVELSRAVLWLYCGHVTCHIFLFPFHFSKLRTGGGVLKAVSCHKGCLRKAQQGARPGNILSPCVLFPGPENAARTQMERNQSGPQVVHGPAEGGAASREGPCRGPSGLRVGILLQSSMERKLDPFFFGSAGNPPPPQKLKDSLSQTYKNAGRCQLFGTG